MISSIFGSGLRGIQSGVSQAAESASEVSQAFSASGTGDPSAALIDLTQAETQVKSSASLIKTGDELLGAVLDIFA